MSKLIPDFAAIDFSPPAAEAVTAVFAGQVDDVQDILVTGTDALAWYSTAIWSDDLVFAMWPDPEASIIVYAGRDYEQLNERLKKGILVLVAGGGLGPDVPYVVQKRISTPPEVTEFFGIDRVVVSSEEPITAAVRRLGHPDDVAEQLSLLGATVTIFAGASSVIAQVLAEHVSSSLTLRRVVRFNPNLITRVAWTRALGSFQLLYTDSFQNIKEVISGSVGPTATIVSQADVEARVNAILSDESEQYDIIAAAQPGGGTTFITDITSAFTDVGPVILTGQAVPPRTVVVLRGQAADVARSHLEPSEDDTPQTNESVVVGPPAAEDRERFIAHQWASAQRRAEEALSEEWSHGGPTLVSEANSIGIIDLSTEKGDKNAEKILVDRRTPALKDGATVKAIAYARGWHIIDTSLSPVLDSVLLESRKQISGDDTPVTVSYLNQLRSWGREPGFWENLSSATLPSEKGVDDVIVFPYPPTAVELLRAVVAADGDAAELRRLLGPVKVAVMKALGPKKRLNISEGGELHE